MLSKKKVNSNKVTVSVILVKNDSKQNGSNKVHRISFNYL